MCGLTRLRDAEAANEIRPEYAGFVFAEKSRRAVPPELAREMRDILSPDIRAVGVFVNESPGRVADLLRAGVIDIAQLHGDEDGLYIEELRKLTDRPVIQAFRVRSGEDILAARESPADFVLLDSGAGTGRAFDWDLIRDIGRPYFLAGGLDPGNVGEAVRLLRPFAVDVSSGIETDGRKDREKMAAFAAAVRKEGQR